MVTPASERLNGMEVKRFEQLIVESRERIINTVSEALDAELERFLLPADRVAVLWDFAKFACFLSALKVAEVRTPFATAIEKRAPLRAWHEIGKQIDKEVPVMLLEAGREAAEKQVQGIGEGPSHEA